ncbi:MAG: helix-turn-helix transcriptional regulator [Anaerolineales bacterium]|nr:helix-turn-helix transcriptional regulator [Anaerolineales bacterium]
MNNLSKFLKNQIGPRQLRKTAGELGISAEYLSRIRNGSAQPGPRICASIADHYGLSRLLVLRMAGHIDPGNVDLELADQVMERIGTDPDLQALLEAYIKIRTPAGRQQARVLLEALVEKGGLQ